MNFQPPDNDDPRDEDDMLVQQDTQSLREGIEAVIPICPVGENGEQQYHEGWNECRRFVMDKSQELQPKTDAIIAAIAQDSEPVARLLKWEGPKHHSVPHGGICARTFEEFPLNAGINGYWKETGTNLFTHSQSDAAKDARIAELEGEAKESAQKAKHYEIQFLRQLQYSQVIAGKLQRNWIEEARRAGARYPEMEAGNKLGDIWRKLEHEGGAWWSWVPDTEESYVKIMARCIPLEWEELHRQLATLQAEHEASRKEVTQFDNESSRLAAEITRLKGEVVELRKQHEVIDERIFLRSQLEAQSAKLVAAIDALNSFGRTIVDELEGLASASAMSQVYKTSRRILAAIASAQEGSGS